MGSSVKLGMVAEVTFGTAIAIASVTEMYELVGGDLNLEEDVIDTAGLVGTRSRISERTRTNMRKVTGSLTLNPNALELVNLLPRILGGAAAGTSFPLAETLPFFTVAIDKSNGTDGKVPTYSSCYINSATFKAEQGQPLSLELQIEGVDETLNAAGSFPNLTLGVATGPFIFSDAVYNVGGSAYNFKSFECKIDNQLDTERFMNSLTRTAIPSKGRVITVTLDGPYSVNSAVYPTAATAAAGVAVTATFTNTIQAVSLLMSFVKVHFPRKGQKLNGRDEVMMPLVGEAKSVAATKELVVTLDSTP